MGQHHPMKKKSHPFNELIENFWNNEVDLFDSFPMRQYHPNISLSEDENKVYVDAALPGLDKNEIEITLEKGILWIRGQKQEREDNKKYHYKAKNAYSYHITLPDTINEAQDIDARYENGILHVIFNKARATEAKKIQIKH